MGDPLERLGSDVAAGPEESSMKEELCMEIDPPFRESLATADDWRKALSKVVPAVVVLRTTACRAFDTEAAGASYATGFVVDKRRGIILTNRHVVKPGPVVAEAMFVNREEVPVYPIYRDPVHDFGFFRYDPGAIQFLSYEEIPLSPEAACVGLEIRVVGNDSGEKVSILAGTLARLDRDAPHYKNFPDMLLVMITFGFLDCDTFKQYCYSLPPLLNVCNVFLSWSRDGYNDFNTFYMQAASGTKGGSSGSPVIDWQGRAVALNAGSKSSSASAFFLPLERVVRALQFLQKGRDSFSDKWEALTIPRGTLQVTFLHKGFDETRRLGLQSDTEQMVRHASPLDETGMLVVDSVVPGGPAHNLLEPGDVLVRVNGNVNTQFLKLETLLDDSVGRKIELQIERGGTPLTVDLMVQDLHSITPDHFLEVSGAVIHPLSYQQARNFRFNCGLVYVAEPGYMLFRAGVPRHAIIKKFGGEAISGLEDLISVLSKLARGSRVPLEYISYMDRHRKKSVLVTIDRHEWYAPPQIYTRDDSTGLWTIKSALPPESPLLSSCMNNLEQGFANSNIQLDTSETSVMVDIHQDINQGLVDGVSRMDTSSERVGEGTNSRDDSDVGAKKRRVEEDSSADSLVANCSLHEPREEKLDDSTSLENALLRDYQGAAAAAASSSVAERVIEPTLVMFEVHVPPSCMLDGVHSQHFFGTGVIIYHSHNMGLVVVDKNTVAIAVSDIMLSFAAFPIEIPGEVVFLHPVHNYAIVAYDPSALGAVGASVVRAAELLPEPPLHRGDAVYLVGLSRSLQATSRKSVVTNPHASLNIGSADCPRYRATNMEVIELDTDFGSTFSGVLTDEHGRVQAIWGSFSTQLKYSGSSSEDHQFVRGIPVYIISQVLDKIISGANGPNLLINGVKRPMPLVRILEVELYPTLLSKARSFGLSDKWVQALVKKDPVRRQVLRVKGCLAGSKADNLLEQGDMVLAINKEPITCFRDIEDACQALEKCDQNDGKLNMTIFRQGQEIELLVGTDVRDGNGSTRVINWCGCIVQDPHPAVRALGFLPEEGHGVYVARWCHGSPVHRYGLYALQWIVEVNGKPTPDLDAFVDVTKEIDDGKFVRVRTVHLNGKPRVLTLKQDLHYWPTWELRFDPETAMWRHRTIKALDCGIE
ncbi:hypothetical protein RHSIM_Rhsim08G0086100 [Rhododendron simsii]|uniref:PDZ domain-containing protein n=1 Tax=Rhododendron simsii TaxID=118357 RepID=A0A834GLC4_RHOSS|nr:hypothetical protein RHSIM_Rhsim08G0086100 [Rhododendron simsii]